MNETTPKPRSSRSSLGGGKSRRRFSIDDNSKVMPAGLDRILSSDLTAAAVPIHRPTADKPTKNLAATPKPAKEQSRALRSASTPTSTKTLNDASLSEDNQYDYLDLRMIDRDPEQPRQISSQGFSETSLQELADSIVQHGVMQPILVRPIGSRFRLIAGERRWRAAQLAGLTMIPAIIRNADDETVRLLALIENLQREDLNPLEQAQAIDTLAHQSGKSNSELGAMLGKSKSTVGLLRGLLKLDDNVQDALRQGNLAPSIARTLISLAPHHQRKLSQRAIREGWNARRMEQAVAGLKRLERRDTVKPNSARDANIIELEQRLSELYCSPITIKSQNAQYGQLIIRYTSYEDLSRILEKMGYHEE